MAAATKAAPVKRASREVPTNSAPTNSVPINSLDRIGQTAGMIWQLLSTDGPLSQARIVKELKNGEVSRDVIMQGLGWLAREDKIWIDDETRSKMVSLKF
jgi:hypothetical protein